MVEIVPFPRSAPDLSEPVRDLLEALLPRTGRLGLTPKRPVELAVLAQFDVVTSAENVWAPTARFDAHLAEALSWPERHVGWPGLRGRPAQIYRELLDIATERGPPETSDPQFANRYSHIASRGYTIAVVQVSLCRQLRRFGIIGDTPFAGNLSEIFAPCAYFCRPRSCCSPSERRVLKELEGLGLLAPTRIAGEPGWTPTKSGVRLGLADRLGCGRDVARRVLGSDLFDRLYSKDR